jgi:hypothetical protein
MNKRDFQNLIFEETGIDTRVRKRKGTYKDYLEFYVSNRHEKTQLNFKPDWAKKFIDRIPIPSPKYKIYISATSIEIHTKVLETNLFGKCL